MSIEQVISKVPTYYQFVRIGQRPSPLRTDLHVQRDFREGTYRPAVTYQCHVRAAEYATMSNSAFYRIAPDFVHLARRNQVQMVVSRMAQDSTCTAIAVHSFGMVLVLNYDQVRVAGEKGMRCNSYEAGRVLAYNCVEIGQRRSWDHIQVGLEGSLRPKHGLVDSVGVDKQAPM